MSLQTAQKDASGTTTLTILGCGKDSVLSRAFELLELTLEPKGRWEPQYSQACFRIRKNRLIWSME